MSRAPNRRLAALVTILSAIAIGASTGQGPAVGSLAPGETARYIVQLADPPLATYTGTLPELPATAPNLAAAAKSNGVRSADAATGRAEPAADKASTENLGAARLDVTAPAAIAYAAHLADAQARVEQAIAGIAPRARRLYDYHVAFNGLTVRLTPREAEAVARLAGVVAVTPESPVEMMMDAANPQIEAPAAWSSPRVGGQADAGRGVRIAILDTGISAGHAMFDDTGFTAPPGFPKATRTVGDRTTPYDAGEAAHYTNHKVIVARLYINPELADNNATNPLPIEHPHGTHVAGIAAGDVVHGGPNHLGAGDLEFSGVAPAAYLMSYKAWYAYTPEFVKMIDDAVADGADVINNSWGTALMNIVDPELHPVSQAFKAATAANVVVVASAGNAGSLGEATLGGPHQLIGDVITVSMVETGRRLAYAVRAEDEGLADNLTKLPAQYGDTAETWSMVDAPVYTGDACLGAGATSLKDKILLIEVNRGCATPVVTFPTGLQQYFGPWAQQLAGAERAGAAAVVLYSAMPNVALDFQTFALLRGVVVGLETLPPTFFIAGSQAKALADWGAAHPSMKLQLHITPERSINGDRTDLAHASTSQGPAPDGPHAALKPDISAPGVDILSAVAGRAGEPAGYDLMTGTSMASPVIAGAAAVLRQAWPEWTPAQVKAALMTTSDPFVTTPDGQHIAPATLQGAGRVNLAQAIDPGALVMPPSLNLGTRRGGSVEFELRASDVRAGGQGDAVYQVFHEPGPGNSAVAPDLPAEITVPAGGSTTFKAHFSLENVPAGAYDGRILLESDNHIVRVVYGLRVPGPAKDVLLINNRRSYNIQGNGVAAFFDAADYRAFWTTALDEAELSYDVWTITEAAGTHDRLPPLSELARYRLVIVAGGDSKVPLEATPSGMTPLQMYLLGGGRLLASGNQWPHQIVFGGAQGAGATHMLNRYFAGFELRQNDAVPLGPFQPLRLFDKPVQLAARASADAAGNGGKVDIGRPLTELVTRPPSAPGQPQPPDNPFVPVAVDLIKPHIRSYLDAATGGSVMTGVSVEATLEQPERAPGIPWRAMFAGFPIEAVAAASPEQHRRAEILAKVFAWAVEPEEVALSLTGPADGKSFAPIAFQARPGVAPDFGGPASFRWDAGDGRAFFSTTSPTVGITYNRIGNYTVRVEMISRAGHSHVATTTVAVARGEARVYLPVGAREGVVGGP